MYIRYDKEVYQGAKVVRITAIDGPRFYPLGYTDKPGAIWHDEANRLIYRDDASSQGYSYIFAEIGAIYTADEFRWRLIKLKDAKRIYLKSKQGELEKWEEKDLEYSWEGEE